VDETTCRRFGGLEKGNIDGGVAIDWSKRWSGEREKGFSLAAGQA